MAASRKSPSSSTCSPHVPGTPCPAHPMCLAPQPPTPLTTRATCHPPTLPPCLPSPQRVPGEELCRDQRARHTEARAACADRGGHAGQRLQGGAVQEWASSCALDARVRGWHSTSAVLCSPVPPSAPHRWLRAAARTSRWRWWRRRRGCASSQARTQPAEVAARAQQEQACGSGCNPGFHPAIAFACVLTKSVAPSHFAPQTRMWMGW